MLCYRVEMEEMVSKHLQEEQRINKEILKVQEHGPNIYKDTKPKMSSLLVFNRLEIQSDMLVFSTPLVN
jgi:hypothetical protein